MGPPCRAPCLTHAVSSPAPSLNPQTPTPTPYPAAGSLCRAGGARCFTATATALTGYRPGPLFKSPSDAAWVTFAKRLGLPALVNLKDYKMVLSQALKGQERRAATNDKVSMA